MASRHSRMSVISDYAPLHVNAIGTLVPVGKVVSTTSATTIAPGAQAVTPLTMYGIEAGAILNIANGAGTAEDVRVTAITATTFTATFVNAHSGAYTIIGHRGTFLGRVVVNAPGTSVALTLRNGNPNMLPLPTDPAFGIFAVITPVSGFVEFGCACDYGLYYTLTGTPGDVSILFADMPV